MIKVTSFGIRHHLIFGAAAILFLLEKIEGCAVLSKCANPECSEQFRFLHEGKLFQLTPSPDVQPIREEDIPALYERFWLCDRCVKKMTVVWAGSHAEVGPLKVKPVIIPVKAAPKGHLKMGAAHAAHHNR